MNTIKKHLKKAPLLLITLLFLFANSCILVIEEVDDIETTGGTVSTYNPNWLEINNYSSDHILVEYTMPYAPYNYVYVGVLAPGDRLTEAMPDGAANCTLILTDEFTNYDYSVTYHGGAIVDFYNNRTIIEENVDQL